MSTDNFKKQPDELGALLKHSLLHLRDPDFDNKLMQRISLINERGTIAKKNIRLSWIFLFLSMVLFPLCYIFLFNSIPNFELSKIGLHFKGMSAILYPAGIILFSSVILLQIDNLFRLTFRRRFA
jgi:hypothetical protein